MAGHNTITIDSLPVELIDLICEHLAPADIPSFRNTSRKLHDKVLPLNEHCNRMVRLHYSMGAIFFLTTLRNGWLVPSHSAFTAQDHNPLGLNENTKLTKIHRGSPHYLQFLDMFSPYIPMIERKSFSAIKDMLEDLLVEDLTRSLVITVDEEMCSGRVPTYEPTK